MAELHSCVAVNARCVLGQTHNYLGNRWHESWGCWLITDGWCSAVEEAALNYGTDMCVEGCLHGIVYSADMGVPGPYFTSIKSICYNPATNSLYKTTLRDLMGPDYRPSNLADINVYIQAKNQACFSGNAVLLL